MKFKIRDYKKLSKARVLRVRRRSTNIALKLNALHLLLYAKTEEELANAIEYYKKEASVVEEWLKHPNSPKLPRKLKKREKQKACDIFNAYALIPGLVIYIRSKRNEEESN